MKKMKVKDQEAMEKIKKALFGYPKGGYYIWSPVQGLESNWLVRVPNITGDNKEWMEKDLVELIHICRPLEFYKAMKREGKHDLALHSGYVHGGSCNKCKEEYKLIEDEENV